MAFLLLTPNYIPGFNPGPIKAGVILRSNGLYCRADLCACRREAHVLRAAKPS